MEREIIIRYESCGINELAEKDRILVDAARAACKTSYAPHSGFHVGAAALLTNGLIVNGSNQESDVYPSGLCAERVLLFTVKANYPQEQICTVALAAYRDGDFSKQEVYPCGACAQTFVDMEARQEQPIKIIMTGHNTCSIATSATQLLPFGFKLNKK